MLRDPLYLPTIKSQMHSHRTSGRQFDASTIAAYRFRHSYDKTFQNAYKKMYGIQ